MTTQTSFFVDTYYSGTVAEKLARSRSLYQDHASRLLGSPLIREELERLRQLALALGRHMQFMNLGERCSQCASRADGGCCSAYMADNTDSIQMLINMLVDVDVREQNSGEENCRYLGERGCIFLAKPIFCLNYNCSHILNDAQTDALNILYQLVAEVLSQQTRLEFLVLDTLGRHGMGTTAPRSAGSNQKTTSDPSDTPL
jgi:hypothetical protein